ncbi:Fur family transcriptional regulator [Nitrospira sp. Kam-Ns4a]
MSATLAARLRATGRRLTRTRKAILAVLEQAQYPLSAADVHRRLTEQREPADLVTVYRTLAVLKELGLVFRVEFQEGQFRYEIRQGREHHHHIRCRGCGRIADLALCPLRKLSALVERLTRFRVDGHALEFFGWCPKCR